MIFLQTPDLNTSQKEEVKALETLSLFGEGLQNSTLFSKDLNYDLTLPSYFLAYTNQTLVGVLSAFFPTPMEVEFTACIHPSYRRQGLCTTLIERSLQAYRGLPFLQALFVVESTAISGNAYISKRYPIIDRIEYRLSLSREQWKLQRQPYSAETTLVAVSEQERSLFLETGTRLLKEDPNSIERMFESSVRTGYLYLYQGQALGIAYTCHDSTEAPMIHGVVIDPTFRRKGHGRAMLSLLLDTLFKTEKTVSLEVDSNNPQALSLYKALGFTPDFEVAYHSLILS